MISKLSKQTGFSLIELLTALLISTVLILGVSTAFTSITSLVNTSKNLENAQEVLRYCAEVFTRSLKQTSEDPVITGGNQISIVQGANSIACDGTNPTYDYKELLTVTDNNLTCTIKNMSDLGAVYDPKIILTGVETMSFSNSEKIISVTVQPQALFGEESGIGAAKSVKMDFALSEIILINAMGS